MQMCKKYLIWVVCNGRVEFDHVLMMVYEVSMDAEEDGSWVMEFMRVCWD